MGVSRYDDSDRLEFLIDHPQLTVMRMAVPSWRWFRLVSDALSLEIPEPGFVLVAPE